LRATDRVQRLRAAASSWTVTRRWAAEARSPAHLAAARGEDDAHRRPQRHERVPPGSPKGVAGDSAPARLVLKWRFKFLSLRRAEAQMLADEGRDTLAA
jgi:hypothetical protein